MMPRKPLGESGARRAARLAALIRAARDERRLTQEEVARAAGIATATLQKIEQADTRTPEFFTVAAIARRIDLSLDDLAAEALDPPAEVGE